MRDSPRPEARPAREVRIRIVREDDLILARRQVKRLAGALGFPPLQENQLTIIVVELGRNILEHARRGEIVLSPRRAVLPHTGLGAHPSQSPARIRQQPGMSITARDRGPGIRDLDLAMRNAYSTTGSTGHGLPAVYALADTFEIRNRPGRGISVHATLWRCPAAKPLSPEASLTGHKRA